jgi:hypothetical protein
MTHSAYVDSLFFVENRIDNPVIANANSPQAFFTGQFESTMWARLVR